VANILKFPAGPWQILLEQAYAVLDSVAADGIEIPRWSLGGGTVLMFHYEHRLSKDIDIFLPDPQFLGYINPRIGGKGEDITQDYSDGAEFVKLYLPQGEIDFVASSTLTTHPFVSDDVLGRSILLETPVEIVAKKIWYRGDRATPRDLLDLAIVIDHQYDEILKHKEIFAKNIEAFAQQCETRKSVLTPVFNAIEKLNFDLTYDECLLRVNKLKHDLS
jgi:hypothetical protein